MGETAFTRYSRVLLAGGALFMLLTAAFNRVVDPFHYFGAPHIPGFNAVKSRLRFFEREVKPAVVQREQPEALILGSSIAEIGFEPLHPALAHDGRVKSYNFAMAGASWKQVLCDLEFVLAHTHVKRIVFGVLAQPMPIEDCTASLAAMTENRLPEVLVSPQAVQHSLKTLRSQDPDEPQTHTPQGRYLFFRGDARFEERSRLFLTTILSGKAPCSEDKLRYSLGRPAPAFVPDPTVSFDASGLKRILKLVSGRHIQLKIVIYPRHVLGAEAEYLCGDELTRWQMIYAIARFIETHPPASPASVEVWDFQGYGPDFDNVPGSSSVTNWQDLGHFNVELGNKILDWMYGIGGTQSDPVTSFGYRVNSATVGARYRWLADQRSDYLKAHPETWDTLMRLVPSEVHRSESRP